MTEAEWAALERYVRWMADALWLRDWTFTVSREEPDEEGWMACCQPIIGRRAATLQFRGDFRAQSADCQRQTVVHELLHCHTASAWHLVHSTLLKELGQSAYNLFCDGFRNQMEYAVDAIADAVSGFYPLIDWAGKEDDDGRQAEHSHAEGSAVEREQGPTATPAEEGLA